MNIDLLHKIIENINKYLPRDKSRVAIIELTDKQKVRIEKSKSLNILPTSNLPKGLQLLVSENETLKKGAQKYIKDGVITID